MREFSAALVRQSAECDPDQRCRRCKNRSASPADQFTHADCDDAFAEWIDTVQQADGFEHVAWDSAETVTITTLDTLIDRFGIPDFCKIDVEGYELEVLRGLSQPIPALSFEYLAASKSLAVECVERLTELGAYRFNWSRGESQRWQSAEWLTPQAMIRSFTGIASQQTGSGDVYAKTI